MLTKIGIIDLIIIIACLGGIVGAGVFVGLRKRKGSEAGSYFLAGNTLSWASIGLALFATNISCLHLVSLAQAGYDSGLLMGNFEWMAAFTLIALSLFFVPFYMRAKISTVSDFPEKRYCLLCAETIQLQGFRKTQALSNNLTVNMNTLVTISAILIFGGSLYAQAPAAVALANPAPPTQGPFKPDWGSLKAHQDPEWFRDAKFGIYTHWGPVTVGCEDAPQGGEWYGREMYLTNNPIFAWHKQKFGDQHTFGYKDVIPLFTATKFDPEKWADLFARAGAKFAGPVAVHHDNFAMWDSAVTPWNSVKMGPKRDITGELAKAYRARRLKFVPTFHHGFAWRYFEPGFDFDAADGKNFMLYTEPHGPKDPPSQRFQEQWLAMVMEVVRQYEPDMIWFDFELKQVITPEFQQRMFADYYNWAAAQGKWSAVAHKFREIHAHTGILDFERGREDRLVPYPWLTDTALGPWFNRKADKYRTTENLIHVLADIVSKNGCMLLNVGPNADGSIPERAEQMLIAIGAWLKVSGEAIYGTRPWLVFGEGPTRGGGGGGFTEGKDPSFSAQDIRFTQSKDGATLYAIALGWPEREFAIRSIQADAAGPAARVELLGHGPLPHRLNAEKQIVVSLPAQRPGDYAFAFKLTGFKASLHPTARFGQPNAIRLEPAQVTCEGNLRSQDNEGRANIGFWDNATDHLHWLVQVKTAGRYTLRGEFSSANGPSSLKVAVAGQSRSAEVPKTDGWFKPQFVSFGELRFDQPGVFHLTLEPSSPDRWRAVNVYQLQLATTE